MSGLKKKDTPILTGYQILHNYIRPHEGLDGKTPAEACGMTVEGKNKWMIIIQNASHSITHLQKPHQALEETPVEAAKLNWNLKENK